MHHGVRLLALASTPQFYTPRIDVRSKKLRQGLPGPALAGTGPVAVASARLISRLLSEHEQNAAMAIARPLLGARPLALFQAAHLGGETKGETRAGRAKDRSGPEREAPLA